MKTFVLVLLMALPCLAGPLLARFDDLRGSPAAVSLFQDSDAGTAKEEPIVEEEEVPRPERGRHFRDEGEFGLAFWVTPFVRFTEDPSGVGAGFGFEFSYQFDRRFGATFGMSIWNVNVRAFEEDDDPTREDVTSLEFELGSRFYALNWRSGRMYMDLRLVLAFADGPTPVRSTVNLGGDMRWGFEFGSENVCTFLEAGMGWRSAVNFGDAGWLETGTSNGSGGMIFDLLRVGVRMYF